MTEAQEVTEAPKDRMTAWEEGTEKRGERGGEEGEREGVLGEDKHSWGSQLLNNSERLTALSAEE